MGSPEFAVPALKALAASYPLVGVVTQPDRPAGRSGALKSPAVKVASLDLGIPIIQPEKIRAPEAMDQLRAWAPDLIVVAAFGQILRPDLLNLPRFGCINIHGSLLPRWRGAAPVQAAILAGDNETGITIMKMDPGIDTGPLLGQRRVPISSDDSTGTLTEKLTLTGAELLLETLPSYISGSLIPQPQPGAGATYAPILKKEDGHLDFNQPAAALERRVRAMNPWPGAFFEWKGVPLKVLHVRIISETNPIPGIHLIVDGYPALGTTQGILILEEVQPAGKKPMRGKAFLTGVRVW
jgi:methionyl-tRNA formyltransferase